MGGEVSADLFGHPERLAAAGNGKGTLDDSNARAMAQLGESPTGPVTAFANLVGVVTNGTAVLGLGAIGPTAMRRWRAPAQSRLATRASALRNGYS